jgi:hypothetical protein
VISHIDDTSMERRRAKYAMPKHAQLLFLKPLIASCGLLLVQYTRNGGYHFRDPRIENGVGRREFQNTLDYLKTSVIVVKKYGRY